MSNQKTVQKHEKKNIGGREMQTTIIWLIAKQGHTVATRRSEATGEIIYMVEVEDGYVQFTANDFCTFAKRMFNKILRTERHQSASFETEAIEDFQRALKQIAN